MQKITILISSLLLSGLTIAQNAVVIDNTKENEAIFNDNNPLSFVSILQTNAYYLGYMEIDGMSLDTYQQLTKKEKENVSEFIGQPGTTPIQDEDPNSPNYGKPIIVTDPVSGQQSFVYEAPDTVRTFLDQIDRMVIEYKDGEGSIRDRATRVSYLKQIDGVYRSVFSVNAQDVLSFDGFAYFKQIDEGMTSKLFSNDSNTMWSAMRKEALKQKEMYDGTKFSRWRYDLKLNHFPADAIRFGFFNWSDGPRDMNTWEEEREIYYAGLSANVEKALYPFGLNLGGGVVSDTSGRAALLSTFDGVYSAYEVSDKPMIDRDPNSPNFGNEMMVENADGSTSILYPDPKEVFFWLDYTNAKVFIKESFHQGENGNETSVDAVYFTIEVDGTDEVISVIPFNEAVQEYFDDYKALSMEKMEFNRTLDKALNNKKFQYDLNNPTTVSKLRMK